MRAYFRYYPGKFDNEESKVFFASSRLEGQALKWFQPALEDYLTKTPEERDTFTDRVFDAYVNFEDEIYLTQAYFFFLKKKLPTNQANP